MAEEETKKIEKKKEQKEQKEKQVPKPEKEEEHEILVRILGYDIPGSKNVYAGLTRIKGVSWAIANATCVKLKIPHFKKISQLSKDDIKKIENFLADLPVYDFLKNRRFDIETGKTEHLYGSDLDMKKEFDIKRLKEIKSYRGIRHALKQPVRGQRTRSHFRQKGRTMGVKKKSKE